MPRSLLRPTTVPSDSDSGIGRRPFPSTGRRNRRHGSGGIIAGWLLEQRCRVGHAVMTEARWV
eukprot:30957-Pelagococcus_subviridis.AAC.23